MLSIFSICLLVIYIPSLEKYLVKPTAHFKIGLSVFSLLGYKSSLYGLLNPYQRDDLQIFYPILWIVFLIFGGYVPGSTKVFAFDEVQFIFSFVASVFVVIAMKPLPNPRSRRWMVYFFLGVS